MATLDDRHINPAPPIPIITDAIPEGQVVTVKEEWFDGEGFIFLIWGILNPNGPTLYCLGQRCVNGKWRVFFRWLHMLGGCTTYAAKSELEKLTYNDIYDGAVSIHNHLIDEGDLGIVMVVPSFLIVNQGDETIAEIAKRLLKESSAARADWERDLVYLRTFGTNLFGRAGCEIREFYEEKAKDLVEGRPSDIIQFIEARYGQIPDFRDAVVPTFEHSEMTPALLHEWWSTVTTREFCAAALGALSSMWSGAISVLPDNMKQGAVSFDRVADFLVRYRFDCAVAFWKNRNL